jgi:acetyltransferase-like isoleucine patch superfamily enzyme
MTLPKVFLDGDWFPGGLPGNIVVGRDVYIDSSYGFDACHSDLDAGVTLGDATGVYDRASFIVGPMGRVTIGAFTCLNGVTIVANRSVRIGDNCLLAWGAVITDTSVPSHLSVARRREVLRKSVADPHRPPVPESGAAAVVIDDNVWIGFDSVVLPGVHVGRGSVVGCKSVVDQDVPPYTVMVGNPARAVATLSPDDGPVPLDEQARLLRPEAFTDRPGGAPYLTGSTGGRRLSGARAAKDETDG